MIVQVILRGNLEYFIETDDPFDFWSLRGFLIKKLTTGTDYEKGMLEQALVAITLINAQGHGFPIIGGACTGAYRFAHLPEDAIGQIVYGITLNVISVEKLED